tara:strand:- start:906 stop:4388 length:3483 start_codon:yes stop_codon:yes gene_type:complete
MLILTPAMSLLEPVESSAELNEERSILETSRNSASTIVDVPNWRIGDRWNYDGFLDVRDFVADSGVETNVETLDGTLDTRVTDIYTMTVENVSTLVYKVESEGEYEANDVNLAGYDGDLIIDIDTIEIVRASDLASIEQEATIDIDFDYQIWWWTYTIHVADLVVTNEYSPSLESYDFPISVGESWETAYTQDTTYSGSSDYVEIPDDTTSSNSSSWEVVSRGSSGVSYGGCGQSYNITVYDSDGDETGYRWYCPAIRNDIKSSTTESIGFIATHELNWYQQATRARTLDVDLDFQLSPLSMDMNATITVTNNAGNALADQQVEFRYEVEEDVRTFTTDSNGQFIVDLNSGGAADNSLGGSEHGSHGIIAWLTTANQIGVTTLITDENVHEVDLIADSAGVTVDRTRDNRTVSLNSIIGFAAVPGDVLTFSVPVVNRGILTSPATEIRVVGPDGVSSTSAVPALDSLQEERVEISWTVPVGQPSGDATVDFVVDEAALIANDGNRSNNYGSFTLFIGRLPTASLIVNSPVNTFDTATLNGLYSTDPDGGSISCVFEVETLSGTMASFAEEDCVLETNWEDDGEFLVRLTVTDEESDTDSVEEVITVLNRPPEIIVDASTYSTPVLSPVTFEVTHREDMDTSNPFSPVDIAWQTACEEGSTVSARCTITPSIEGEYTIEVIGMDDDGATVTETVTIDVTNIAPSNPGAEVWRGNTKLTPDTRGVYSVDEGDALEIRGWAEDSENDIDDLIHLWSPDAEDFPEIQQQSVGQFSTVEHVYTTSGLHLATLVVTDDDGESAETLTVAIEVKNVAPTVDPISNPLPVAEDGEISITATVWDTLGDLENLQNCFDLDPETNSDGEGGADDDCDLEGTSFVGSWPDATTAPSSIIFHTMDDDGERAFNEVPITVNNVKPSAHASVSEQNPTEGDTIVLSGNLTTDSAFDLQNLNYHWDLDTSVDSDGDGNPSNDADHVGRWFEWKADSPGTRTIKLTVSDESMSDSKTLTITVEKAPFTFANLITSPAAIILIILLLAGGGGFAFMRLKKPDDLVEAPPEARRGRRVSMDDAFDDPEFDPFSEDQSKRRVREQERDEDGNLTEVPSENTGGGDEEPEPTEPEEAPVIQMTELDEEYEQIGRSESLDQDVLSDLLEDDSTATESSEED